MILTEIYAQLQASNFTFLFTNEKIILFTMMIELTEIMRICLLQSLPFSLWTRKTNFITL